MDKILVLLLSATLAIPAVAIERSSVAKREFAKRFACPATQKPTVSCKGYVIDHIEALDCGGKDHWKNMQWQTIAEGKAKDKWERNGPACKHRTFGVKNGIP